MDKNKTKIRNDLILLSAILLVSAVCALIFFTLKNQGRSVEIMVDGKSIGTVSLEKDTVYEIKTDYGNNTLVVKDKKAYISSADCPDKLCENHAAVSRVGQVIVCLPHRLSVWVTSQAYEKAPDLTI